MLLSIETNSCSEKEKDWEIPISKSGFGDDHIPVVWICCTSVPLQLFKLQENREFSKITSRPQVHKRAGMNFGTVATAKSSGQWFSVRLGNREKKNTFLYF